MNRDLKLIAAGAFCSVLCFTAARAEEPAPPKPKPDETKPADTKAPEKGDLFKIPEKYDSSTLVTFCKRLMPELESDDADSRKNAHGSLRQACDKILTLEKGDGSESGHFARRVDLLLRTQGLDPTKPEFDAFVADFKKFFSTREAEGVDVQLAMELPGIYEHLKKPEKAKELCDFFGGILSKHKDQRFQQAGKTLEGTGRRMDLVGNEMVLTGTAMDGKKFDVKSMKGKVVLVDFWATWCGFCIQEIPNVRKNYTAYHKKGFEVVGISADEDRAKLEAFLADAKLPWMTLHEKDGTNPAMEYYGIPGFPTTFLIGKDGKVLALEARGEDLGRLLKEQLGEPDPMKEDPAAAGEPEKKAATNVENLDKRMKEILEQKEKKKDE